MTPDEFFGDHKQSKQLFEAIYREIETFGESSMRASKSQIAFRRRRGFAWAWVPGRYLKRDAAPLVLSLSLPYRDASPRWKQIVEPYPGRFMHHLELKTYAKYKKWPENMGRVLRTRPIFSVLLRILRKS